MTTSGVLWPELCGCRIQRIDMPAPELLCLGLHGRELSGHLVAVLQGSARGVGLCETRPRGDAASAFVQRLRKLIGDARLQGVETAGPSCLRLRCTRREGSFLLHLEFGQRGGNTVLIDSGARLLARLHPVSEPYVPAEGPAMRWPASLAALREAGPRLLGRQRGHAVDDERESFARALRRRRKQLQRRLQAIAQDAERAQQAPELRARAGALLAQLHALRGDETEVTLQLPDGEHVRSVVEPLPPGVGPRTHAELLFKRARRLQRGAEHAREREALTRDAIAGLDGLLHAAGAADTPAEITALREQARALGVARHASGPGKRGATPPRLPYREYVVSGGLSALVGRGARDNDALTTQVARPHDIFLHARDTTGAHVILRVPRGKPCPAEALVDAATLAAHFSDARGEGLVDVVHVERRHVRKPRGAAAGAVTLQREKVLRLRIDAARVSRLLQSLRA